MNKEFKLASGFFDVDFSIPKGFPVAVKVKHCLFPLFVC